MGPKSTRTIYKQNMTQEPYNKYDHTKWDPGLQEPYQKINQHKMGCQNARTIAKHMTTQKLDPRVQEPYQNK